jgi:hypothetical protein
VLRPYLDFVEQLRELSKVPNQIAATDTVEYEEAVSESSKMDGGIGFQNV